MFSIPKINTGTSFEMPVRFGLTVGAGAVQIIVHIYISDLDKHMNVNEHISTITSID